MKSNDKKNKYENSNYYIINEKVKTSKQFNKFFQKLILFFSLIFLSAEKNILELNFVSEIKMRVTGSSPLFIISQNISENQMPDRIIYNETILEPRANKIEFSTNSNSDQKTFIVRLIYENQVQNFSYLFYNCSQIFQFEFINFSNPLINNMESMFSYDMLITSIDLSTFDTSLVTNMNKLFYLCFRLKSLDISNFNTSKVTNMEEMFAHCPKITSLDLNHFDTSLVTTMKSMFFDCSVLESLVINKFNTSLVENMESMFAYCIKLQSIDLSNFDNSKVTSMANMFNKCNSLTSINFDNFKAPLVSNMRCMFCNCSNLQYLNLESFNSKSITTMYEMFRECFSLKSLNIKSLNTSLVEYMNNIFYKCTSLESLDLSNFDTNSSLSMEGIFAGCSTLSTLDLSNFNTSKVINMGGMFINCGVKFLNLSNFDTSSALNMNSMFQGCKNLNSLILNNFDTSSVVSMSGMFKNCISLTSLDIDNFDTKSVTNINQMFLNCPQLVSLDLSNFDTHKVRNLAIDLFAKINPNLIYCLNTEKTTNNLINLLKNATQDCPTICFGKDKKLINDTGGCIDNCLNINKFKYEYNNTCYKSCPIGNYYYYEKESQCFEEIPKGFYEVNSNDKIIDKCIDNCYNCSKESIINNNSCYSCNNNEGYYQKYNDSSNIGNFVKCYNEIPSYYFDNNDNIFKPCYSTCSECNAAGNENINNCIKCYPNYYLKDSNCYKNIETEITEYNTYSDFQTSSDENNKYSDFNSDLNDQIKSTENMQTQISENVENIETTENIQNSENAYISQNTENTENLENTENMEITENIENTENTENLENAKNTQNIYPFIKVENNEYTNNCSSTEFFNYICKINHDYPNSIDIMINTIKKEIINNELSPLILSTIYQNKDDLIALDDNITYQITSTYNQNYSEYNNLSIIKLGECESILRDNYKLNNNETILIFKIENKVDGFLIPIIEYEAYNLDINKKLDLNLCNQTKIKLFHPVSINENYLFKYDSSSRYYNDFCFPFTTENNTDIILDDRRNEFIDNNLSLCESNCDYNGYIFDSKKAECECLVKKEMPLITNIPINKKSLLNSFKDIQKEMNLKVMKCYRTLFSKEGIKANFGFYIMLIIIVIEICSLIYFIYNGYNLLYIKIQNLAKLIHELSIMNENNNNNIFEAKPELNKNDKTITFKNSSKNIITSDNKSLIPNRHKKIKKKIIKKKIKIYKNPKKNHISSNQISIENIKSNDNIFPSKEEVNKNINNQKRKSKTIIKNNNNANNTNTIEEIDNYNKYHNDYEINNLDYQDALKYDKRTYFQYYFSLIKTKQVIIFTFFTKSDYNSSVIKISLFLFSFALFFTVNALFFNDSTMHKIYQDKGKFNFIFQIPKILYSSIISATISSIIKYLSLTEKKILDLKNEKNDKSQKLREIIKCLKIKFILYFIFLFLFLLLFCYYISCFCAVYKNTQLHLIEDTSMSFGTSLLYPFGLCLIPGMFRIPALISRNNKCLYTISKLVQLI